MSLKQTASIISTYTADVMGVCSALFELGGMCVMHDASGCNSTYSTHDEPRWYDMDSMVYISGLSEMEALMGDDEKLIDDILGAAKNLKPKFIAIAGTPIPMMTGFDFKAVARVIEKRSGIPTLGLATNGTHSYISGADMAFEAITRRFVSEAPKTSALSVNIIGATPLDFSVNGSVGTMKDRLRGAGFEINACFAMGDCLETLSRAASAHVSLVVSACGFSAAEYLYQRFGIPYVAGVPMGAKASEEIALALKKSAEDGKNRVGSRSEKSADTVIIGEAVWSCSLSSALKLEYGVASKVVCPLECSESEALGEVVMAEDEDDILPALENVKTVIADPLYRPMLRSGVKFIPLPHEGFSGRIYRDSIPNLCQSVEIIGKELI